MEMTMQPYMMVMKKLATRIKTQNMEAATVLKLRKEVGKGCSTKEPNVLMKISDKSHLLPAVIALSKVRKTPKVKAMATMDMTMKIKEGMSKVPTNTCPEILVRRVE